MGPSYPVEEGAAFRLPRTVHLPKQVNLSTRKAEKSGVFAKNEQIWSGSERGLTKRAQPYGSSNLRNCSLACSGVMIISASFRGLPRRLGASC